MTVPVLTYSKFIEYLGKFGYTVVAPQPQDFWNDHNRIIIKNGDGQAIPLQFKEKYFYLQVVRMCMNLGIPAPEDHQHEYDLHMNMRKKMQEEEEAKRVQPAEEEESQEDEDITDKEK